MRGFGSSIVALLALSGCAADHGAFDADADVLAPRDTVVAESYGVSVDTGRGARNDAVVSGWGEPTVTPASLRGPYAAAEPDGPYLLDTGDKLRIFVYGQPNLSRGYSVDHSGRVDVPLIGEVKARGLTTGELEHTIRARLASQFVRDPQVTVDIVQNRPFFILGEVKSAGQYPYVSGMTVETAVAIAGGYSDRASTTRFRISHRINGGVEQIEVPADYVVQAGDTVTVFERFF